MLRAHMNQINPCPLECEEGEKSRWTVALRAASTALEASSRATRTTSFSVAAITALSAAAVSYLASSRSVGAIEGAAKKGNLGG